MQKSNSNKYQVTIYYNPQTIGGKKALAYAQQTQHPILALDITKTSPTPTGWLRIAQKLNVNIDDLVQKDHPWFANKFEKSNLGKEDWLKIIEKNPEIILNPIVIKGKDVFLIKTPTSMLRLLDNCC